MTTYFYHGTSPLNVKGIRKVGLCSGLREPIRPEYKNSIWFTYDADDAIFYSTHVPKHIPYWSNRARRKFKHMTDRWSELPTALLRVSREELLEIGCELKDVGEPALLNGYIRSKCPTKCIKPKTLDVCILPSRHKFDTKFTQYKIDSSERMIDVDYLKWCNDGRWKSIKF